MIIYPELMPILWTLMDFFMGFLWFLNGKLNGDFMDLAGIGWDFIDRLLWRSTVLEN